MTILWGCQVYTSSSMKTPTPFTPGDLYSDLAYHQPPNDVENRRNVSSIRLQASCFSWKSRKPSFQVYGLGASSYWKRGQH